MKKFTTSSLEMLSPEVWVVGAFFITQPFVAGNSIYFIVLLTLFILLFLATRDVLETVWLSFLASLPFSRGKYFEILVLPQARWGGPFDIYLNTAFLFSDLLIVLALYLILRNYKNKVISLCPRNRSSVLYVAL